MNLNFSMRLLFEGLAVALIGLTVRLSYMALLKKLDEIQKDNKTMWRAIDEKQRKVICDENHKEQTDMNYKLLEKLGKIEAQNTMILKGGA